MIEKWMDFKLDLKIAYEIRPNVNVALVVFNFILLFRTELPPQAIKCIQARWATDIGPLSNAQSGRPFFCFTTMKIDTQ